jgi:L-asparaginase II
MRANDCEPLVEIIRGETIESIHYGAFIVVDAQGTMLAGLGNPDLVTFPRSSMKPFQALPFIERGGAEVFGFTDQEIAIMCASHSGTAAHQQVLTGMHEKIGTQESDLDCGVHWPGDAETRTAMRIAGEEPRPFHHNCSGKHTGMLAYARLRDVDIQDYLNPSHPIQVSIRETLVEMVELSPEALSMGIDGCSAPVYAFPLRNMALGVAKLADPVALDLKRANACRKITKAMMSHPTMIAGPGKFDTQLMTIAKGKVFSKGGAEGYQIIGVMPGVMFAASPALGIAIKIADGDTSGRARAAVSMTILEALGILDEGAIEAMRPFGSVPLKNWRKLIVGEIRPVKTIKEAVEKGING